MQYRGPVFVCTGSVFDAAGAQVIGRGQVEVPRRLYNLVYDQGAGWAWANWVTNTDEARAGPPISCRELVRRTGIEFLPGLDSEPSSVHDRLACAWICPPPARQPTHPCADSAANSMPVLAAAIARVVALGAHQRVDLADRVHAVSSYRNAAH